MKHLRTTDDLSLSDIETMMSMAAQFSDQRRQFARMQDSGRIANLFFEPSTRTKLSFEVAEQRLGMHVLGVDEQTSSVQKGETLYDTIRLLEEIGVDGVVIRHPDHRYFDALADSVHVPIINAGDGSGNHPTQSLLDLLTMRQEFTEVEGLTVVIAGDICHSRVAQSNASILQRLGANLIFTGPSQWMDRKLCAGRYLPLDEAVEQADVMMMLRIQSERHAADMNLSKEQYHQQYGLTLEREKRMKPYSMIMHPAPVNRDVEIASSLIECGRSRIFKQMANGVAVRMAVLQWALAERKGLPYGILTEECQFAQ